MKKSITKIVVLFFVFVLLTSANIFGQKYNKVENTAEVCECVKVVNDYLNKNIPPDIYEKTGIIANYQYNNLIIINAAYNHDIGMTTLYEDLYRYLKDQTIDYSKVKYIMLQNYENKNGTRGNAIIITGKDFKTNLDNFESIKSATNFLNGTYALDKDPDVVKILTNSMMSAVISESWGSKNREKVYSSWYESCLKRVEKAKKKAAKK